MDIKPGDTIYSQNEKDRFQVIKPIGSGSFGIVYEVQDINTGNRYALKTIITTMLDSIGLQALTNEGNLASSIEHGNVLRVYYYHDGQKYPELPPYMLMEYADGGTLENFINRRRSGQSQLTNKELREIFIPLALGMKAINEKLIHRDVKPDNILFVNGVLKISDFGLSKVSNESTRTQTFKGINHIKYCSPEAWHMEKNTLSMDMYSMGIIFYELATLNYPYDVKTTGDIIDLWKNAHLTQIPQSPNKVNSSLDLDISQLIMKMIEKRPESRYSSWDEVIQRIENQKVESGTSHNVSGLVQKAMDNYLAIEQERQKQEDEIRRRRDQEEIISYCFQEIIQSTKTIIDGFNKASEFYKLEFRQFPRFTIEINRSQNRGSRVVITVSPIYTEQLIHGRIVKAWGFAKAPSGRGFNLLLVNTTPDDIYGQWVTFHVSHSPIARREDTRPDPFPFEITELPSEIQYLNAMHIYKTEQGIFQSEFLNPLIEELL